MTAYKYVLVLLGSTVGLVLATQAGPGEVAHATGASGASCAAQRVSVSEASVCFHAAVRDMALACGAAPGSQECADGTDLVGTTMEILSWSAAERYCTCQAGADAGYCSRHAQSAQPQPMGACAGTGPVENLPPSGGETR